ncbi:sulfatase family protein [Flavilitoribacter nigricans]|uniref:Sulfatase n=1 Tax=Flavilitoribacter nigricans (strain ATCC 23147 / DSM 23189 / NBRC 102662 / NCIMB 1420 / SS-2) TaxID=1122177 RepID=A0A2D0NI36_FLAN2|nr:sulfatase [Flavilitoribacter nigricans]PHN08172.1 sulfatase [Flavilitoribacter nigricans DSM 23189 = NBRC 102662]
MRSLILILLAFTLWQSCSPEEDVQRPPNILWILAEDLSPDLGCYNYPLVRTPNVDALAARGLRFTHAFTTAPVCTPSRTALATGMYQTSINAHHMRYPDKLRNDLPEPVVPLNELLRRQGYKTANIKDGPGTGKSDWSFRSDVAGYDYQHWDSLTVDQPFFAVINLRLTHRPFERDTVHPVDPDQVTIPPYYPDHPVARRDWAQYLETVQVMDEQVGEVLATLEERGLSENTIVVFFSDHGRPMSRGKLFHYDSGYRIPLIIAGPAGGNAPEYLPAGTTDERMISGIDITATTLAMTGADKPEWMQGRVVLGPQTEAEREYIYCASDRIGETFFKTRSVRNRQYKYIRNFNRDFSINSAATAYRKQMHPIYHLLNIYGEQGKLTPAQQAMIDPMPEELLFDLEADPMEIHDLATDPEYAEVLVEMRQQLADWQEETVDHGMDEDSEAIRQAFYEYGVESRTSRAEKIEAVEAAIRAEIGE